MRLVLRYLSDAPKRDWYVIAYTLSVKVLPTMWVDVPAGYVSDGCSVPVLLWGIFPPLNEYAVPGIVHDYLYETKKVDRKTADWVFLVLLNRYAPHSKTRNYIRYLAVRVFGRSWWRKARYVDITNYKE